MSTRLELAADYESARQIGPWLSSTLALLEAPQAKRAGELELALHELAINIIDHAYDESNRSTATYSIDLTQDADDLHAHFCDQGQAFVDDREPRGDTPTVGGYGLMIVEQLAKSVTYERVDTENRWTLVFSP